MFELINSQPDSPALPLELIEVSEEFSAFVAAHGLAYQYSALGGGKRPHGISIWDYRRRYDAILNQLDKEQDYRHLLTQEKDSWLASVHEMNQNIQDQRRVIQQAEASISTAEASYSESLIAGDDSQIASLETAIIDHQNAVKLAELRIKAFNAAIEKMRSKLAIVTAMLEWLDLDNKRMAADQQRQRYLVALTQFAEVFKDYRKAAISARQQGIDHKTLTREILLAIE